MQIGGLHHVTAITGDVSVNVAFYTQVLGLHLVKKTVNQDDVSAYHVFYGDQIGGPGTELTFFDWPQAGPNRPGYGTVAAIAFGVRGRDTLDWWIERFDHFKVPHEEIQVRAYNGTAVLPFQDPEGQRLELVEDGGHLQGHPWEESEVPTDKAIRGLYAIRITARDVNPTAGLLTETLGFRQSGTYQSLDNTTVTVYEVGPGGPGAEVHLDVRPGLRGGRPGIGGVHHVAFRTPDQEEQEQWREKIGARVGQITPVIERFYFKSVYFREPGGVLFEIATDGPGFTADEDAKHLGQSLSLPPFLESQRGEIEANLRPIIPFRLASVR